MLIEARGYANKVEVKTAKSGKTYTTFSLGVKQKEKAFGNQPEKVTWANFNCTDFSGTEIPNKAYVTVKGYLNVREYEKDGAKRTSLDVKVTEIEVAEPLGSASGTGGGSGSGGSNGPQGASGVNAPEKDPWED